MKKFISAVLASAIAVSSAVSVNVFAEKYGDNDSFVLLGDSIASGEGLKAGQSNYGQMLADYVSGSVENYAVSGETTGELNSQLSSLTAEELENLKSADNIVISIGGNDMMQFAAKRLLKFAINNGVVKEGNTLTADDVDAMDKVPVSNLLDIFDMDKVKEKADNTTFQLAFGREIMNIENDIVLTTETDTIGNRKKYIQKYIIPEIQKTVDTIKGINPNAEIVLQNVYNPFEIDMSAVPESYSSVMNLIYKSAESVVNAFNTQIQEIEGVTIVDIKSTFKGNNDLTWFFTGMDSTNPRNSDIHPNLLGHSMITYLILDALNVEPKEDGGEFRRSVINYMVNVAGFDREMLTFDGEGSEYCGSYTLGDISDDGKTDAGDASDILKEYASLSTNGESTLEFSGAADINCDGKVDAGDASDVLSYYAALSTGYSGTLKKFLYEKNNK